MWLIFTLIGLALLAWYVFRATRYQAPEQKRDRQPSAPSPLTSQSDQWRKVVHPVKRGNESVTVQTTRANQKPTIEPYIEDLTVPDGVIDLRALDSRRLRVVGVSHYLDDDERVEAWTFQLVREPQNIHDENAIAVLLVTGRKIGHIAATQAATYAPLLDELGTKFLVTAVGSAGTTSSRIWVDLPKLGALRSFKA